MEQGMTIKEDSGDSVAMDNRITRGEIFPCKGATRRFNEMSELIIRMGNNLPDKDLYNLCLVNSRYNALFSPRLYRNIVLNEKFLHPNNLTWGPTNPRFLHTKVLTFDKTTEIDESPELRCLNLSYLHTTSHTWKLERICKLYRQLGGIPLNLEILILGEGVYLDLPEQELSSDTGMDLLSSASYLSFLINPACIQEMGVIVTSTLALGTFDSSFLPNIKEFRLSSSDLEPDLQSMDNFFERVNARDFFSRVHLHVDGWYFTEYPEFKNMIRYLFACRDENDDSISLAPLGFSFPFTFPDEDNYKWSIVMPLPETRILDIAIYYPHLIGFVTKGLSEMLALEYLTLKVYVYDVSQWNSRNEVIEIQLKVLGNLAGTCPKLRYARMEMSNIVGDGHAFSSDTYPVPPAIEGLSRSWKIDREFRPGSCTKKLHPLFTILDAESDKSLRPQSMWSEQEKRDQYITETTEPLGYLKPLWMT
ncbi:hypothetical protein N8I77_000812 [Diaporthe amygdali]|uniref:Uncharacterized protein n=1 Tax=Phomopsis amygdali TaxID=1214568 RepID=A0AAD9SPL5_PHOAM|nr:hypothetical protein N8I77_000812 [Diaporthe amygdali]